MGKKDIADRLFKIAQIADIMRIGTLIGKTPSDPLMHTFAEALMHEVADLFFIFDSLSSPSSEAKH